MLAFAIPAQVVFNGALTGLTYGLAAVALILVYRTSRVINLATAELGGFAAGVLAYFLVNQHVSYWVALPLCVGIGAAAGALVELVVVRRLSNASRLLVLVATIGVAQILLFGQAVLPKPTAVVPYPTPFTSRWEIGGVFVRGEHLAILIVMPALCLALAWFLARTRAGLQIRAAAANPDAGRLAGIHVRRTSTAVWALAGAFTALATILAAPFTTSTSSQVITLGSGLLVRVLAAALIGRMSSLPGALAGGVLIGIIDSVVFYNAPTNRGLTDLILFLVVVVVLLALSRRPDGDGSADWSFAPRSRTRAALGGEHGLLRWLPVIGAVLAIGVGPAADGVRQHRQPAVRVEPGGDLRHGGAVAHGADRLDRSAVDRAVRLRRPRRHDRHDDDPLRHRARAGPARRGGGRRARRGDRRRPGAAAPGPLPGGVDARARRHGVVLAAVARRLPPRRAHRRRCPGWSSAASTSRRSARTTWCAWCSSWSPSG